MRFTSAHGSPSNSRQSQSPRASARHGSAEQIPRDVFGRSADYLTAMTPPVGESPRPSRARSPEDDDRDERRQDRDRDRVREARRQRREEQAGPPQQPQPASAPMPEPVGLGFRLNACETSLRDHNNELAAQKIMLQQLVEASKMEDSERTKLNSRLHVSFTENNEKHSQREKENDLLKKRLEVVMNTLNSMSDGLHTKFEQLEREIAQSRRPSGHAPPPHESPLPTPPSWGCNTAGQTEAPRAPANTYYPGARADVVSGAGFNSTTTGAPPPSSTGAPPPSSFGSFGQTNQAPNANGQTCNTPGPSYFNVSSPNDARWSPLNPEGQTSQGAGGWGHTNPNSQFGAWAPGAGSQLRPFDEKEWSVDGKKVSKELRAFDGNIAHYDNWRTRVRDHFIGVNCNYSTVFRMVEKEKAPISWASLAATRNPELPYVNWQWMATHLWTFTGQFLTDTQLQRRTDLTLGEEFNGLELWRALYGENSGGSAEMATCERGFFIDFPKCEKAVDLRVHLGQWLKMKQKYGGNLPQDHLVLMFQRILPDDVLANLKLQRDMKDDLQRQISHVFGDLGTSVDQSLSKWNLSKLQKALKPTRPASGTSINAVHTEPETQDFPPPPVPDAAAMQANIERMVAAAIGQQTRGRDQRRTPPASRGSSNGSQRQSSGPRRQSDRRTPNPRFQGCWCCGSDKHSRADCPEFKAIKAANNGRVPKDYVGAYEKSLKKDSKTKVASLTIESPKQEFNETVRIWPVMKLPKPVSTSNTFKGLNDELDDDDGESDMVKALSQLTSHVQLGSQRAQSQRQKKSSRKQVLNTTHLNAIARDVLSGKIDLPDVDLKDNREYTYVWALVDSGAGANVAQKGQFPNSKHVSAPRIYLTTADGARMPNRGAREVVTMNKAGVPTTRRFYDADVEMPILSVAELSQEGEDGSDVRFRKKDGYIEDNLTKRRDYFVKRKGVYFTKLYVSRPNNLDFTRPGP